MGAEVGPAALAAAVSSNKYNRRRLLRFAAICRVKQAVAAAEKVRRQPAPAEPTEEEEEEETPKLARTWDRDLLEKQVWSEPIRQLAKKYGVSDVAIHKQCKKMGIQVPGRGSGQNGPVSWSLAEISGRNLCSQTCASDPLVSN